MDTIIEKLKLIVNTLETVEIKSTKSNLEAMFASIRAIEQIQKELESTAIRKEDDDGKV